MTTKHFDLKKKIFDKLKELRNETFTSDDISKFFPDQKEHVSAILREFTKRGKLKILGQVSRKGYKLNVHAFPDYRTAKQNRIGFVNERLNEIPTSPIEVMENWNEVWPDMFKLPSHLIRKPGQYRKFVHIQGD